jgi:hypothetical protein
MKFKIGDLLRHKFNKEVLVVKETLSNNRLKVNFHNEVGHEGQQNWEIYEVDCIKIN